MPASKPVLVNAWGNANTSSPDMVAPTYFDSGFPAPGGTPVKPPRGYINWLFNYLTNAVRYFMQRGISNWDAGEDGYTIGSVVRSPTDGLFYQLLGTATTGTDPAADPTNWVNLLRRDANGLPVGKYDEWYETWAGFGKYTNSGGAGTTNYTERWQYKITGGDTAASIVPVAFGIPTTALGGNIDPGNPPGFAHHGGLMLECGSGINDLVQVCDAYPMDVLDDNVVLSIETTVTIPFFTKSYWVFGFSDKQDVNSINDGAFFIAQHGTANWNIRSGAAGVFTGTSLDTGIAVSTGPLAQPVRLRIVARGASMGLGARQVQFYIDDVWVGAFNANLPFADASGGTGPRGSVRTIIGGQNTVGGLNDTAYFGPIRYAHRYKNP